MADGTQVKIISVRAFAKEIGVSEGAVRKAIKSGRFKVGVDSNTGKIDPEKAKADDWVQQQSVIKPKAGVSRVMAIEKMESKKGAIGVPPDSVEDEFDEMDLESEDIASKIKVTVRLTASESMRRQQIVALAKAKKELQELEGVLVRRDAVDKALFLLGSELKKSLLDIPARCVRDIMAAETEVEGIKILIDELVLVLKEYGNLKPDNI